VQFGTAQAKKVNYKEDMSTRTEHDEFDRLVLQIERDLVAQSRLRTLLTTASTTVADHRQELRSVKARIKRSKRV
jgi:hypothetical protein